MRMPEGCQKDAAVGARRIPYDSAARCYPSAGDSAVAFPVARPAAKFGVRSLLGKTKVSRI